MTTKLSISFTDAHAEDIEQAVAGGEYASASEVVRDAIRTWKTNRRLGQLWDEGIASGRAGKPMTISEIKAEARRRAKQPAK